MSQNEWNELQQELQALKPEVPDSPADAFRFKKRVLQAYERRTRRDVRARWVRRTAAVLAVGVAACVALLLPGSQPVKQGVPSGGDSMYAVVSQVVSLFDENRYDEAMDLFVRKLGGKPLPAPAPKFDLIGASLPDARLAVYSETDTPAFLDLIPKSMRIDPAEEVGMTIANGAMQSFSFDGQTVRVTVLPEAGRLQVLAVEADSVKALSGHSFALEVVDTGGVEVAKRTVKIP